MGGGDVCVSSPYIDPPPSSPPVVVEVESITDDGVMVEVAVCSLSSSYTYSSKKNHLLVEFKKKEEQKPTEGAGDIWQTSPAPYIKPEPHLLSLRCWGLSDAAGRESMMMVVGDDGD